MLRQTYLTVLHFHSKRNAQIPAVLNSLIWCQTCLRVERNHYDNLLEFSFSYTLLHGVISPFMSGFRFNMDILYSIDIF